MLAACRKCGEKLQQAHAMSGNPVVIAKDKAKQRLIQSGRWKKTRVITTDCLDVCPLGQVTVMRVCPKAESQSASTEIFVLNPIELDRIESLLEQ